ncbi:MAG: hypothetical protein FJ280_14160 [Planctomycetes bacterium]|nr:hypothetical protein [Planctomycetota bacterium]
MRAEGRKILARGPGRRTDFADLSLRPATGELAGRVLGERVFRDPRCREERMFRLYRRGAKAARIWDGGSRRQSASEGRIKGGRE